MSVRRGPLKLKLQILCGEVIAMGPGKADLLEAIRQHGSISAAGRALAMSYRRTWLLVGEMNRCWSAKLVATARGGGADSGARLTPEGARVLAAYRALEGVVDTSAADSAARATLEAMLREAPRD